MRARLMAEHGLDELDVEEWLYPANPGVILEGQVLKLDEPLSFWGAFDPKTGMILDQNHPQSGACIKDRFLVMPGSRGSAGTPGGVAEAIRIGAAPKAILLGRRDVNIAIGAAVADRLYAMAVPVLCLTDQAYLSIRDGDALTISG